MEEKFNLNQLLQKPIAMMTGEELCFLIAKSVESTEKATSPITSKRQLLWNRGYCPCVWM